MADGLLQVTIVISCQVLSTWAQEFSEGISNSPDKVCPAGLFGGIL